MSIVQMTSALGPPPLPLSTPSPLPPAAAAAAGLLFLPSQIQTLQGNERLLFSALMQMRDE